MVKFMVEAKANVNAFDNVSKFVLWAAFLLSKSLLLFAKFILDFDIIYLSLQAGTTSLHEASRLEYCAIMRVLLEAGANVQVKNKVI